MSLITDVAVVSTAADRILAALTAWVEEQPKAAGFTRVEDQGWMGYSRHAIVGTVNCLDVDSLKAAIRDAAAVPTWNQWDPVVLTLMEELEPPYALTLGEDGEWLQ